MTETSQNVCQPGGRDSWPVVVHGERETDVRFTMVKINFVNSVDEAAELLQRGMSKGARTSSARRRKRLCSIDTSSSSKIETYLRIVADAVSTDIILWRPHRVHLVSVCRCGSSRRRAVPLGKSRQAILPHRPRRRRSAPDTSPAGLSHSG